MGPDYFNKKTPNKSPDYFNKEPPNKISKKHEKDVEKRSNGRRTPGSGNISTFPGDVKDKEFLRECKATHGAGIQIKGNWLSKICKEAYSTGRNPLLEIRLQGQDAPTPVDWILIPALKFQEILEKLNG